MIVKNFEILLEYSTEEQVDKIINALEELKVALDVIKDRMRQKYFKRVRFKLELMGERAVDAFYESYTPHIYKRNESLYTAYKITVDENEWSLDIDENGGYLTGTNYDSNYVYINSFVEGYHGGAVNGPDHPEPGIPWWKFHGEWLKPATRGPSILKLIEKENPAEYIDQQYEELSQEVKKLLTPFLNKFYQAINS